MIRTLVADDQQVVREGFAALLDELGAERVIAIDRFAERLNLASSQGGAETLISHLP